LATRITGEYIDLREPEGLLFERARRIHPEHTSERVLGDATSRFRA